MRTAGNEVPVNPFVVEVSEPNSRSLPAGRYVVIFVGAFTDGAIGNMRMLAYQQGSPNKQLVDIPITEARFIGFLGECLMCEHKPVEAP